MTFFKFNFPLKNKHQLGVTDIRAYEFFPTNYRLLFNIYICHKYKFRSLIFFALLTRVQASLDSLQANRTLLDLETTVRT